MSPHVPRIRMSLLGVVILALFSVLTVRLYDLQIVGAVEYKAQAEANRVRLIQLQAPRGQIIDRNGEVVVDNEVVGVVTIDRVEFRSLPEGEREEVLFRLASELQGAGRDLDVEDLQSRINSDRYSPYAPVPVARDVSQELQIYFAEHAEDFPSVHAGRATVRSYPYGSLAANVLGYVGSITESELEAAEGERDKPYDLNDEIGKAGLELAYEEHLRGVPGFRQIEVDAEGDPVRVINEVPPIPGSDVHLTLDANLQALAQRRLEQGLQDARERPPRGGRPPNGGTRGAVVVEDPNNGQILAMASYPSYDPREFVNGISQEQWAWLNDPANHYPLNNWAIQGQWAPGSTFKLFTAYAALAGGVMAPDTPYFDSGGYTIPGCRGNACFVSNAGSGFGSITLPRALTVSSNAYFANVGGEFWLQQDRLGGETAMQQYMAMLGVGSRTGIPLAYEAAGRLPSAEWQREYCAEVGGNCDPYWGPGHNAHMAIGQGSVLVTPLQLVNGYATMANGGTRYQPQIVDRIVPPHGEPVQVAAEVAEDVHLPPDIRGPIQDGLVGVTQNGTASGAFAGFPHDRWPVAGKTGTGEFETKAHTATFASYGPVHGPEYAIAVVMEESDFGGTAAAPVARTLYEVLSGVTPMPQVQPGGGIELPGPPTGDGGAGA